MSKTDERPARNNPRRAAVVSCWMCGICMHSDQMTPDGGSACEDVRWYCKDARACTQRWTASRQALDLASASKKDSRPDTDIRAASEADLVGRISSDVGNS